MADVLWWALDEIRLKVIGRDARYSRLVLELARNPGTATDATLAVELLTVGLANRPWLSAPIGSVVLVAPGGTDHPAVGPVADTVREQWPAATLTVLDETVAALLGAAPDPEPAACVVVHQDAVRTSVGLVAARAAVAGDFVAGGARGLADRVIEHLRAEHRLDTGLHEAWAAVVHDGAFAPPAPRRGAVHGSPIVEGRTGPLPSGTVTLGAAELHAVLAPAYRQVADLVARVLRDAPSEAVRQARAGGLLLTGTHPPGADTHLAGLTGLPAHRAAEPRSGSHHPEVLLNGVARLLPDPPPRPATPPPPELLALMDRLLPPRRRPPPAKG
ncbi:rod shape-determining protein [Kitasatospora sp. NPDC094015]|uniref:rod shape-determining protein n=1 Tax=Kitasatospora sp. NPDC094015 TaxID=3155205 RepID=UPI00332102B6